MLLTTLGLYINVTSQPVYCKYLKTLKKVGEIMINFLFRPRVADFSFIAVCAHQKIKTKICRINFGYCTKVCYYNYEV